MASSVEPFTIEPNRTKDEISKLIEGNSYENAQSPTGNGNAVWRTVHGAMTTTTIPFAQSIVIKSF